MLQSDDSYYLDAKKYHLASFSARNSMLNTSLRKSIRMQDFIPAILCEITPKISKGKSLIIVFKSMFEVLTYWPWQHAAWVN